MSSNLMPAKFSGSTEITGEGIRKHFNSYEPWQAIIELVWNSFDAKADKVSISIARNPINQITSVTVLDDGEGIDYKNYKNNFAKFN
ncbi:TPA: ATP-binding protein, partial [Pseudomonas aeruginosa]|nr:ATP-binding protein [Pseudomonas aeruginosa]